jgi:hypothetical protein
VNAAFFWSTLPCYLYILYYAVSGARVGRRGRDVADETTAAVRA